MSEKEKKVKKEKKEKKVKKADVPETPEIPKVIEPHIVIYSDRVEVNGDFKADELALTIYLIQLGEYTPLLMTEISLRLEQSTLTEEQKNEYTKKFTQSFKGLIANEQEIKRVFSSKPLVRPLEAFR